MCPISTTVPKLLPHLDSITSTFLGAIKCSVQMHNWLMHKVGIEARCAGRCLTVVIWSTAGLGHFTMQDNNIVSSVVVYCLALAQ